MSGFLSILEHYFEERDRQQNLPSQHKIFLFELRAKAFEHNNSRGMRKQNLYMLLQSEIDILTDNYSNLIFRFSFRLSIMKGFSVGILLPGVSPELITIQRAREVRVKNY